MIRDDVTVAADGDTGAQAPLHLSPAAGLVRRRTEEAAEERIVEKRELSRRPHAPLRVNGDDRGRNAIDDIGIRLLPCRPYGIGDALTLRTRAWHTPISTITAPK